MTITLVPLKDLRPHEGVNSTHLAEIECDLMADGMIKDPIIVDAGSMIILDGHHRYNALKRMGYTYAPVYLVDYRSDRVTVDAWRKGEHVTKQDVLAAGLSGRLLPAKTSHHTLPGMPHHVNVPLALLREENHADQLCS